MSRAESLLFIRILCKEFVMSKKNNKKNVAEKSAAKKEAILKTETKSQSPRPFLL